VKPDTRGGGVVTVREGSRTRGSPMLTASAISTGQPSPLKLEA